VHLIQEQQHTGVTTRLLKILNLKVGGVQGGHHGTSKQEPPPPKEAIIQGGGGGGREGRGGREGGEREGRERGREGRERKEGGELAHYCVCPVTTRCYSTVANASLTSEERPTSQ
jgi:hypothetical protein